MTTRMLETSVEFEVPFHDVDALGVVWHGHYYKYLELARSKLLTGVGLDGSELLALGHRFYIIESRCRYAHPLRYRERVRVDAWVSEVDPRLLISYEVYSLSAERRVARAHTALAITDEHDKLLLEAPRAVLDRLHRPVLGA